MSAEDFFKKVDQKIDSAMFFLSVGNSLNLRDPSSIMLEISDETARFQHPHLSI